MSSPSSTVQGAEFVNDYVDHPDFRLVAGFFLGWVFFSAFRHIWFSALLQELMWTCKAIFDRLLGKTEEPATFTGSLHENPARMHGSKIYRRKQRDAPVLLLCMGFTLASLSSFLSLLTFYPNAGQTACAFVVAATAVASQAVRVCGLLILGLDLRSGVKRPWEMPIFWILLGLGTVSSGVTAVIGTGRLITPVALPSVALCTRKRFLSTSLVSSILNFVLELYIIIRSLSLVQPPRLKFSIVQNARIVQAGSLLLFDLLVVVPTTTYTNLVAEFIPFSIGALGVLAAFNGSFGHTDFVPTRLDVHASEAHRQGRAVHTSEDSIHHGDMSERVIHIDSNPISAIAGLTQDIEAYASPPHSPQATRRHSTPLHGHHDETILTPSPQPYGISVQTTMDIVSPVAPLEAGNRLRREKILSYSNPLWATFGTPGPRDESSIRASTHSQISVEVARSPTSNDYSHERDSKLLSPRSTILGSDIIRSTTLNKGKDRMRTRYSNLPLSTTPSLPSSSRRVTRQSWASRVSLYPTTSGDVSQPGSTLPKEREQLSRSISLLSSKSKHRSKSNQSSKSRKSSNSIHSAKATVLKPAEESPSVPAWIGSSMGPAGLSRPPSSLPRDRVGFVRGPRPPPSASQIQSIR